jgi:chromosome segregation ATPase
MRMREKIVVLLVLATLVLGGIVAFAMKGNETEANYLRWEFFNKLRFFFNSPVRFAFGDSSGSETSSAMMWGLVGVGALVVMIILLKLFRDGELLALRRRLMDLHSAKSEAESLLQEEVWKGKHERQAKDSVTKDLESSIERIETLLTELGEKEKLLKAREHELHTLKSDTDSVPAGNGTTGQSPSERALRDELRKKTELVQARDAIIRELEQRLTARAKLWESQLREKDGLLKGRDAELLGLRADVDDFRARLVETETAKKRAEELLQDEVNKKKELLEASDIASKKEEERLAEKIRVLEGQLGDREKLVKGRDVEIGAVRQQLKEVIAAKEQAQLSFQQQLEQKGRDQQAKETAIKELEHRVGANIQALKTEIGEKDLLLQVRDGEIKSLKSEVKSITGQLIELAAARERSEATLQEELRKEKHHHEARESANREAEERYGLELKKLAEQLREKEQQLQSRAGELSTLKNEVKTVNEKLIELATVRERAEKSLQEERQKGKQLREERDSASRELEARYAQQLQIIESQLQEKSQSLQKRDGELSALKTEIKATAEQLRETAAAKAQTEALLQEERQKGKQLRDERESSTRALDERYLKQLQEAEAQLREKDEFLKGRDGELRAVKTQMTSLAEQLSKVESAKERAAALLQEKVRSEKQLKETHDSALKEIEANFKSKIAALEVQLTEKLQSVGSRDQQVMALKSEIASLNRRMSELAASKEKAESLFEEAVKEKTDLAALKDASVQRLEAGFSSKIESLESRLNDKELQLKGRDAELNAVKKQLAGLTKAQNQSIQQLRDELRQKSTLVQEREAAAQALEERFAEKVRSLEIQLGDHRGQLTQREADLTAMTAKVASLTNQLNAAGASNDQSVRLLQEELRKKSERFEETEAAARTAENNFTDQLRMLESQLGDHRSELSRRDAELSALSAKLSAATDQLNATNSSNTQTVRLLQDEIRKKSEHLEATQAEARTLEERFSEKLRGLESQISEQRDHLSSRESEIAKLTAKITALTVQLTDSGASKDQTTRLLQEELKQTSEQLAAKESAVKSLEERLTASVRSLESQLHEKQELIGQRELELDALMSKVSSLASQVGELESARGRSERSLQEEVREQTALLEARESEIRELEERFNGRLKTLERQVNEKQQILEASGVEVGELRAQVQALTERLKESEDAKTWLEGTLEEERQQKESKSLMVIGNGEQADGHSNGLDSLILEREELLKARDNLINNLMNELKEKKTQLARHEIEVWQGIERRGVWKNRLSKIGIRLKD